MSFYVVDAGVAVKWFIPEVDSDKARALLARYNQRLDDLIAPDLLIAEASNALSIAFPQLKLLRDLQI